METTQDSTIGHGTFTPPNLKEKKKPGPKPKAELDPQPVIEEQIPRLTFEQLKARGIPVKWVVFHNAVTAWDGTPENAFYSPNPNDPVKKSRVADLWFVDNVGIIWERNGKCGLVQIVKEIRFL